MASSTTTGDRRWASSGRRGGMTVLGKVAVPKPINLPSQRLENHGLDPNVEIVPKGTLSWGSKCSSSPSNAWASSALSANTDGSTNSPNHLSARPSSGESGTRPSTAGSEKVHDSTPSAWCTSSRPSSASGTLTSSHTSLASLRPRSAETRPGSSQLSRFAEPLSDHSVAGSVERSVVTSLKRDGFSLSSGDFPLLGSEKSSSGKDAGTQDHSSHDPPSYPSTGVQLNEGQGSINADTGYADENSWRKSNAPFGEDGRPGTDKWHGDYPPYQNSAVAPQQYNAWHGPLVNNPPSGVWYRGPPGAPPYRGPVGPGGFPMEPYPYFRPQIPPPALPSPRSVPPPGAGPRGHHSSSGDMYRPQIPDGYIRAGMPVGPGFYSGHVPYDGYFVPPVNYCNPNERDIPYPGLAPGPPLVYGRYPGQNAPDNGNPHNKSVGYGPGNKVSDAEDTEFGHPHDMRGQYKVLLKQQENWDGKAEEHKWGESVTISESSLEKGEHGKKASLDDQWGLDHKNDEEKHSVIGEPVDEAYDEFDFRGRGSVPSRKVPENVQKADVNSVRRSEHKNSVLPEVAVSCVGTLQDSSLIQKIEGLNAKARASDGRNEVLFVSNSLDQDNKPKRPDSMPSHSAVEVGSDAPYIERNQAGPVTKSDPSESDVPTGSKSLDHSAVGGAGIARQYPQSVQGKHHHRGKGRSSTQDVDGWRKRPLEPDTFAVAPDVPREASNVHVQALHLPAKARDLSASLHQGNDDGEAVSVSHEPSESTAERAKMRELAKQRVKQREVEEEERTRDQHAKARMKLEELNRRTQVINTESLKVENAATGAILDKQQNLQPSAEITKTSNSQSSSSTITVSHVTGTGAVGGKSTALSNLSQEVSNSVSEEPVLVRCQSGASKQDAKIAVGSNHIEDGHTYKQCVGSKHKPYTLSENKLTEKCTAEQSKVQADTADSVTRSVEVSSNENVPSCEGSLPVNRHNVESLVHQRRKGNKTSRNKHKVDEPSLSALPIPASKESTVANTFKVSQPKFNQNKHKVDEASFSTLPVPASKEAEANTYDGSSQWQFSESNLHSARAQSPPDLKDVKQRSEPHPVITSEEYHSRVNQQWKSQHSHRAVRSQQASRAADKYHAGDAVVWAPVRSQNKVEVTDDASEKTLAEGFTSAVKSDNLVQNNPKNKRAEMERYVPKPVAKEMAQQGSVHQQTVTSSSKSAGDTGPESIDSIPAKPASRNGDGKLNKLGRVHGPWRQRGSKEPPPHDWVDGQSGAADLGQDFKNLSRHYQAEDPEVKSLEQKSKNPGDGSIHAVRYQGLAGRGKRHGGRVQKATEASVEHDEKKGSEGTQAQNQSSVPEINQRRPVVRKENYTVAERSTPHWQPKSQTSSAENPHGRRVSGGQNAGAEGGQTDLEPPHAGALDLPKYEKGYREALASNDNEDDISQKAHGNESARAQAKRERKAPPVEVHSHSPTHSPVRSFELGPPAMDDAHHKSQFSSGFRKNQNNRYVRGNESRGDWNSGGQENNHHAMANRERQRPSPHYRYQPVDKSEDVEGSKDGSQNAGIKFKERSGQASSRRGGGNYSGRQVGML